MGRRSAELRLLRGGDLRCWVPGASAAARPREDDAATAAAVAAAEALCCCCLEALQAALWALVALRASP